MSRDAWVSINQLSEQTGADRRSIKKWLAADGVKSSKDGYEKKAALACIEAHRKGSQEKTDNSDYKELIRQQVIKLERENRIAERLENETYMLADDVERILLGGMARLESIPSKLESEFALPANVIKRLTQLLDEARTEWARGVASTEGSEKRKSNKAKP